jgi:O-antigen/teichoic acid export membrane protein
LNYQTKNSGQSQQIIRGSAHVLVGTIVSSFLGVFRSFIIAGGLGPSLFGLWNILMLIFTYNSYADLGMVNGMNKEVPYLRGKGNNELAEKIKNTTFWAVFILTAFINILIILVSVFLKDRLPEGMLIALTILGGVCILFQVNNFLICLLRTDKFFGLLGMTNGLLSLVSLVCVVFFFKVLPNKLYGALLALLVAYLCTSLLIFSRMGYRFRFSLNLKLVRGVFKTGFPLIVIQIGAILLISIDRWMIAGMIDQINLGYYGIGLSIANFLFAGASTVAFTLYPFMLEKFGQSNDVSQSEKLVYTPLIILSYLMAVACPLVALLVPLLITYVLPAYIPGINAAIILILGIYFMCIMTISGNFLVSINKQNNLVIIQAAVIPLSVALNFILIKNGLGIEGVALGTVMTYVVYGTAIILLSLRNFSKTYCGLLLKLGKIYFPFFISLTAFLLLKMVFGTDTSSLKDDLFRTSIQILVYSGLASVLAWNLNRITGVIHMLLGTIRT